MSPTESSSRFTLSLRLVWETKRPTEQGTLFSPFFTFKNYGWHLALRFYVESQTYVLFMIPREEQQMFPKFTAETYFFDPQQNDRNNFFFFQRKEITSATEFLAYVVIPEVEEKVTKSSKRGILGIVVRIEDEIGSSAQTLQLGEKDGNQHPKNIQTSSQNHVVRPSTSSKKSVKRKDGGQRKQNIIRPRQENPGPSRSPSGQGLSPRQESLSRSRNPSRSRSPSPSPSVQGLRIPFNPRQESRSRSQSRSRSRSQSRSRSRSRSRSPSRSRSQSPSRSPVVQGLRQSQSPGRSRSRNRSPSRSPVVQGLSSRQESRRPSSSVQDSRRCPHTTRKHRIFVSEPMGNKSVYEIPGIGAVGGKKFIKSSYETASSALGAYLALDRNEKLFTEFLENDIGLSNRQASQCIQAFLEWCENWL